MAKSILQEDKEKCFLCGRNFFGDPRDKHHVFGGAYRKKSEKFGLTVYLHHFSCHEFGEKAVHKNAAIDRDLKKRAQVVAMSCYRWSIEEFRRLFGKNYI